MAKAARATPEQVVRMDGTVEGRALTCKLGRLDARCISSVYMRTMSRPGS